MQKLLIRSLTGLFAILIAFVFFLPQDTQAAGNCNTTSPRKYMYVYFYDPTNVTWAEGQLNPCIPAAQVSTRTPVFIGRPDQPHTPQENWIDTHGNWKQWQCDGATIARAQVRTFRGGCFPADAMTYIDVWTYPPYDSARTEWEFRRNGTLIASGIGPRVSLLASDWSSTNSHNVLTVRMVPLVTRIQGLKVKMPGNIYNSPPGPPPPTSVHNETITLANGVTTLATTTANPYYFEDLDPQPAYTISATQPAVNYSVGHSYCFNQAAPGCTHTPVTLGNSVTLNSPPGGYTDLWWHYWEYVGWYRLKQASFNKNSSIVNFIPPDVVPYDAWDTDEELLNIRPGAEPDGIGLVTATGGIDIGPNTSQVSHKNWAKTSYTANKGYLGNLNSFLAYARARKEIKVITNINDLESDKINIYQGNLTLVNNTINPARDNMVLIVQGNLTIQSAPGGNFNQPRRSWAILATGQININPSITEMNGIFIANSFDLAHGVASSTNPLKVTGNLISNNTINVKRNRPINDYQRASLYVVFFPEFYYDLVPHLSTITQEGRQLQ